MLGLRLATAPIEIRFGPKMYPLNSYSLKSQEIHHDSVIPHQTKTRLEEKQTGNWDPLPSYHQDCPENSPQYVSICQFLTIRTVHLVLFTRPLGILGTDCLCLEDHAFWAA